MCLGGAHGATEKQFIQLLHYKHLNNNNKMHELNLNLINILQNLNGNIAIRVANKIFLNKYISELKNQFQNLLKQFYQSEIEKMDFSNSIETSKLINNWVSNKTENKINDLISSDLINEQIKMILVNTIYFKAQWVFKFEQQLTSKQIFNLNDGTRKPVDMMRLYNKRLNLNVNPSGINAVTCEFPYIGHQTAMTIILPDIGVTLDKLREQLNHQVLRSILAESITRRKVNAFVPKFKFEESINVRKLINF